MLTTLRNMFLVNLMETQFPTNAEPCSFLLETINRQGWLYTVLSQVTTDIYYGIFTVTVIIVVSSAQHLTKPPSTIS